MATFGTQTNPAHYVEITDPLSPGQVKRPAAGQVTKARTFPDEVALSDIVTTDYGYWAATFDANLIMVSGDGGTSWVGPLVSGELTGAMGLVQQSLTNLANADAAFDVQIQDLYSRIGIGTGGGGGGTGSGSHAAVWNAALSSYEPADSTFTLFVGPSSPTPVPADNQGVWVKTSA